MKIEYKYVLNMKINVDEDIWRNDREYYLCVMHSRIRSAWATPFSYPVDKIYTVFCGRPDFNNMRFEDEQCTLALYKDNLPEPKPREINSEMNIRKNELNRYDMGICDAHDSWYVIISDKNIDPGKYLPGYRYDGNGAYINIEDEKRNRQRSAMFPLE